MSHNGRNQEAEGASSAGSAAATLGHHSDVGRVRRHNEDNYALRDDLGLWVVADGMGGAAAGDKASAIVVDVVARAVERGSALEEAIAEANRSILDAVKSGEGKQGMGSTVVAARFAGSDYHIAWVGDARAYLWADGLHRLSHDHSRVQELVDAGLITDEEARQHPHRSVITRVLGGPDGTAAAPDQVTGSLQPGQGLLLCSDGLTSEVADAEIEGVLSRELNSAASGQQVVDQLVAKALEQGGSDNITVVLVGLPKETAV
ncbi:serine/threonine-protein phosphatase [Pelagibius litoralis]|uniref:Serine/threonine-protein phosphatase n=1 Tax=Pelagibius litoralis TaxID=374515 RepID=A0A967KDA4_9PROT|nr:protein phosphatase 2C domain-containing protein [Pelagibius litoralis]NIA72147.1 serine/threonine-protein phosphatase [Pelagibius litoralis]